MTDERQDFGEQQEIGYFERLIQEEIEGSATESELLELETHLAANPEAAEEREAQQSLAARLDHAPLIDPPTWLKDRILSDIRGAAPAPAHAAAHSPRETEGFWTALRAPFGFARRPIFSFAVGAVAGMLALALLTGRGGLEDPQGLSGAMTPPETTSAAAVIDRVEIDAGGIQGTAEVTRAGDRVTLDFILNAPASAEYTLRFSPGDLSLTSFERQSSGTAPVTLGTDAVTGTGNGRYRITWIAADNPSAAAGATDVHLEIAAAGRTLVRRVKTGS